MKPLLLVFFLLYLAVEWGVYAHQDPGYIFIAFHHTTIETTVWTGGILWLCTLAIVYLCILTSRYIQRKKMQYQHWREERRLIALNYKAFKQITNSKEVAMKSIFQDIPISSERRHRANLWLDKYEPTVAIDLAIASFYLEDGLYGKALFHLLGQIHDILGDQEQAYIAYKKGIALCTENLLT